MKSSDRTALEPKSDHLPYRESNLVWLLFPPYPFIPKSCLKIGCFWVQPALVKTIGTVAIQNSVDISCVHWKTVKLECRDSATSAEVKMSAKWILHHSKVLLPQLVPGKEEKCFLINQPPKPLSIPGASYWSSDIFDFLHFNLFFLLGEQTAFHSKNTITMQKSERQQCLIGSFYVWLTCTSGEREVCKHGHKASTCKIHEKNDSVCF